MRAHQQSRKSDGNNGCADTSPPQKRSQCFDATAPQFLGNTPVEDFVKRNSEDNKQGASEGLLLRQCIPPRRPLRLAGFIRGASDTDRRGSKNGNGGNASGYCTEEPHDLYLFHSATTRCWCCGNKQIQQAKEEYSVLGRN